MSIRRCIQLFLVFSSVGCVHFQDCEYTAAQNLRAHKAWWFGCDERCYSNPRSHYARGWRRGYADVLLGYDGECPPVPPQCYWSHKYQSERGEMAIENWFQGYGDGAAAALASCGDQYNPVPLSDNFRNCFPTCLSSDMAPYPLGKTSLGLRHPHTTPTHELPGPGGYDPEDEPVPAVEDKATQINFETPRSSETSPVNTQTEESPVSQEFVSPVSAKSRFSIPLYKKYSRVAKSK